MTERFQRRGFTLLELLLVIGIMGLLGTVSYAGFQGLKRGMEERGVKQTVNEFVRSAYRRAIIDRVPTAVYFWNETISDESSGDRLIAVGRAVAVRRAGRFNRIDGRFLVDEFGDLAYETYRDEEGEEKTSSDADYQADPGRYLYKMSERSFARSVVTSSTIPRNSTEALMSDPDRMPRPKVRAYAYYVKDTGGVTWEEGDAYGFEFAELTLPQNYIFGTECSRNISSPEKKVSVMQFSAAGTVTGGNVTISGLKLEKTGEVGFKSIGTSESPTEDRD